MNRLVSARWLLPIATPAVAEGAVLLDAHDTILAVGSRAELRAAHPGVREDRADGALLPGLVNAHTHLELSALAGQVPGGRGLVAWTSDLAPRVAGLTTETRAAAAHAAALAMVAAGTAAIGDVANGLDAVPAIARAGLRGMVFHELVGSREARTGDALADAAAEFDRHVAAHGWPDEVAYVPAPHAPYSVGAPLLRRTFAEAARRRLPTSVHVAEDPDEVALLRDGSGAWPVVLERLGVAAGSRTPRMNPVAYLASLGAFEGPFPPLLVHMVHAGDEDRALAARHRATAVLCPRSNLHVGGALPDVPALLAAGVPLAVGTDSLASSPTACVWGELATLASAFPDVPRATWLQAATQGGAHALQLPALGALSPGARPGLLDVRDRGSGSIPANLQTLLDGLTGNPDPAVQWMARPAASNAKPMSLCAG